MKFAVFALLASASAINIQEKLEAELESQVDLDEDAQSACIPVKESNAVFHAIDTNHNHELSPGELYGAIERWARATHRNLTAANVHFIEEHAAKDASTNGHDNTMSKKEFFLFINQFVKYFHLPCAKKQKKKACVPHWESNNIFHIIDTNHNHELNPAELYGAIENWARATHRNLTAANVHFIEEHAAKDASTNGHDNTMSKPEFFLFINQFVKYFKLPCYEKVHYCIQRPLSNEVFHDIDTNHNHVLSPAELYGAIERWADDTHRHLSPANVHWIEEHAAKDASTNGHDNTMSKDEFFIFINQFVHYFKLPCEK